MITLMRVSQFGLELVLAKSSQLLTADLTLMFFCCIAGLGLHGPLYLTGNDGTLMSADMAHKLPLHTFQSGPVNSLRGAAQLSGLSGTPATSLTLHIATTHHACSSKKVSIKAGESQAKGHAPCLGMFPESQATGHAPCLDASRRCMCRGLPSQIHMLQ